MAEYSWRAYIASQAPHDRQTVQVAMKQLGISLLLSSCMETIRHFNFTSTPKMNFLSALCTSMMACESARSSTRNSKTCI